MTRGPGRRTIRHATNQPTTPTTVAALTLAGGPLTTNEVADLLRLVNPQWWRVAAYRALRRLEAQGTVVGFRPPNGGCVLWALT